MYKNPIITFGLILPLIGAALVVVACAKVKDRINARFEERQRNYQVYDQNRKIAQGIEAQIGKQRPHLSRWTEDLGRETASAASENLRLIGEKLPAREFQQTGFDRESQPGGFGAVAAQRASRIRVSFRGSFRTVQRAFAELETRMPRLQLEELSIQPIVSPVPQLNFQATYTSWEQ